MAKTALLHSQSVKSLLNRAFTPRQFNREQLLPARRWTHNATVLRQQAHSQFVNVRTSELEVKIMPVLQNNYMYLVIDRATGIAAAIDPVEIDLITEEVVANRLKLTTAFVTHHHKEHALGSKKLADEFPNMKICGGDKRIRGVNKFVRDHEKVDVGKLTVHCFHTPCHTRGHYCYYVKPHNVNEGALFTGDTLFQAGCGPFLEGTAQQMFENVQLFYTLPEKTRVFGGHENTIANLRFALKIEPNNEDVCERLGSAMVQRGEGVPTLPSTLWDEKLWNPFMRVTLPQLLQYTADVDPIKTMLWLRHERDKYP